jgi:16S rRNA (uracil1498-N3)-methyltransferase
VIADAGGQPYEPGKEDRVRLLVGPEGGWTEGELADAVEAGARVVRFGRHVMRIETAAVVAAGIILGHR